MDHGTETVIGAALIRPILLLALFALAAAIAWPIRQAVKRLPEGRLKRVLLFRWDI